MRPPVKPDHQAFTLYKSAAGLLSTHHIEDAELEAKHIISHVLETDFNAVVLDRSLSFTRREHARVMRLLKRRISGEPVQYVLRSQNFYGLDFYVDKRVLIPRPETEILAEQAITHAKACASPTVLDLCTGSGCIGVTLKKWCGNSRVWASDISPGALKIAKKKRTCASRRYILYPERPVLPHPSVIRPYRLKSAVYQPF